ncbi:MAG: DUF362 domain-containing protein [Spirochaetia bacterium]
MKMNRIVGIVKCSDYNTAKVCRSVEKALQITGFPDVKGKNVLIKPNLLSGAMPEKAVTTHPEILRAAIRKVKKEGAARILVGDSPGFHNSNTAAEKAGLLEVIREEGGALWTVFEKMTSFHSSKAKFVKEFQLAKQVEDVDIIINLPKMKNHQLMYITGAMKNLFGLVSGLSKSKYHMRFPDKDHFAEMIADLNLMLPEVFTIMDGIVAMEGHGPGNGVPRNTGLILASPNVLAIDIAMARITGYKPEEIPTIISGLKRGTWLTDVSQISTPGIDLEDLVIHGFDRIEMLNENGFFKRYLPSPVYKFVHRITIPVPVFKKDSCIRCGECIKICPADALSFHGKTKNKMVIPDYHKCIRCYCCHEICPADAIDIKRKLFY